jgi:hypothetical protein
MYTLKEWLIFTAFWSEVSLRINDQAFKKQSDFPWITLLYPILCIVPQKMLEREEIGILPSTPIICGPWDPSVPIGCGSISSQEATHNCDIMFVFQ